MQNLYAIFFLQSCTSASHIPELDDRFWKHEKMVTPITEKAVSIRLDSDVSDWFKD